MQGLDQGVEKREPRRGFVSPSASAELSTSSLPFENGEKSVSAAALKTAFERSTCEADLKEGVLPGGNISSFSASSVWNLNSLPLGQGSTLGGTIEEGSSQENCVLGARASESVSAFKEGESTVDASSEVSENSNWSAAQIPSGEESVKRLLRHAAALVDCQEDPLERARISACVDALPLGAIDVTRLQSLASRGLPSCSVIRSLFWRIMLGCLPPNTQLWKEERWRMRATYESYKKEFLREPEAVQRLRRLQAEASKRNSDGGSDALFGPLGSEETRNLRLSAVEDHPLSRSSSSAFSSFFRDCDVFDQINKDVFRTRPELDFFSRCHRHTVQRHQQRRLSIPASKPKQPVPQLVQFDVRRHRSEDSSSRRLKSEEGSPPSLNPASQLLAFGKRALLQRLAPDTRPPREPGVDGEDEDIDAEVPSLDSLVGALEAALPASLSHLVEGMRGSSERREKSQKQSRRERRRDATEVLEDSAALASGVERREKPISCEFLKREEDAINSVESEGVSEERSLQFCGCSLPPLRPPEVCDVAHPKRHADVLCRLLFIYAKLNPGILYVQGMNDLIAPIYVALMNDETCEDWLQVEAEVFFCFTELMQFQRDFFCEALDPTACGVEGGLQLLMLLLQRKARDVWLHLRSLGVEAHFFALRWILLLLTQEFRLPDVLILWDAFIGDSRKPLPLVYYVCVALIIRLRPVLLEGDFTVCMKTLQHLPAFEPRTLLAMAHKLRKEDVEAGIRYEAKDASENTLWEHSEDKEDCTSSRVILQRSSPSSASTSLKQLLLEALPSSCSESDFAIRGKSFPSVVVEGVREALASSSAVLGGEESSSSESDALTSLRKLTFFAASHAKQKAAEFAAAAAHVILSAGEEASDEFESQRLEQNVSFQERDTSQRRSGEESLLDGEGVRRKTQSQQELLRRRQHEEADHQKQPQGDIWLSEEDTEETDETMRFPPFQNAEAKASSSMKRRDVPITLL